MFPLSCARVRAHTGRKTSTHKKTWSAQNIIFFEKCLRTYTALITKISLNNSPALSPEILTDLCNGQFPDLAVRLISCGSEIYKIVL